MNKDKPIPGFTNKGELVQKIDLSRLMPVIGNDKVKAAKTYPKQSINKDIIPKTNG